MGRFMDTVRLQFEIDEDALQELDQLQRLGSLRTKKDLLNNAITLLQWAVRQRTAGRAIMSVGEDGSQRELEMPFLETASSNARRRNESGSTATSAAPAAS